MRKYRYPVFVILGILLALGAFLLVGLLLDDETEMEEQPVNSSVVVGVRAA